MSFRTKAESDLSQIITHYDQINLSINSSEINLKDISNKNEVFLKKFNKVNDSINSLELKVQKNQELYRNSDISSESEIIESDLNSIKSSIKASLRNAQLEIDKIYQEIGKIHSQMYY